MQPPDSRWKGTKNAAKREQMMAAYVSEPRTVLGRWKQRRAESWLVNDSIGPAATSLHDTREQEAAMRERWRQWRAARLGR
jgi:hypothetical protein